ncbi:MAG: alpha/beta hydrolase, partial [Actinomycetota bacterium]|nr:alpha/beta hydrolase [Actinomycetota bacterium]
ALIHGASGDQGIFSDLTGLLVASGCTVSAVDLRGHGRSDRAASYTLEEMASDVVETLPVGLDVVIGHSLGALVLLTAVEALKPARAIYLDPPFFQIPAEFTTAARATLDGASQHAGVGEHADGTPFTAGELAGLNPGWGPDNVARSMASHALWDPSMLDAVTDIVFEPREPASAPPAVPSLVVLGGESPFLAVVPAEEMAAIGWEFRIQPGAGHNLFLDDAQGTFEALREWITT